MSNIKNKNRTTIADIISGAVAILGGAWLISKIVEEQKTYKYKCPNCGSNIDYKQEQCKTCRIKLKWEF